jgi:hypothetical protein
MKGTLMPAVVFGHSLPVVVAKSLSSGASVAALPNRKQWRDSQGDTITNAEAKRLYPVWLKEQTQKLAGAGAALLANGDFHIISVKSSPDGLSQDWKLVAKEHSRFTVPKDSVRKTAPTKNEVAKTLTLPELQALLSAALAAEAAKSALTAPPAA